MLQKFLAIILHLCDNDLSMKTNYNKTLIACSTGYLVQALSNNFLPLLFVYFASFYKIPVTLISIIIAYNFIIQIFVDMFSSKFILSVGYRVSGIVSASFCVLGLIILATTPLLVTGYLKIYIGIMIAVTFTAIGSGLSEVILSPIIEALPFDNKPTKMSFLHSFYALGHILTIVISSLFFLIFKIDNWYILALLFIIIPLAQILMFISCPIINPVGDEVKVKKSSLFKNKTFIILFLLMIMAGAAEQAIAQWASYFAETGLKVTKSLGDLLGACLFALFMFISRMWYGTAKKKPNITIAILIFSIVLAICYVFIVIQPSAIISLLFIALCGFFVGILWPGLYSVGGGIFVSGGAVMFSMLALGGDLGCAIGPLLVGFVANYSNIKIGILSATIFPVLLIIGMVLLIRLTREKKGGII